MVCRCRYTANLAAFLTARIFKGGISSPDELSGKAVATLPTYVERIFQTHGIRTFAEEGAQSSPRRCCQAQTTRTTRHARMQLPLALRVRALQHSAASTCRLGLQHHGLSASEWSVRRSRAGRVAGAGASAAG